MVIFLLAIIAVGVLLLSDVGRAVVSGLIYLAYTFVSYTFKAAAVLALCWAVAHALEWDGAIGMLKSFVVLILIAFGYTLLDDWLDRRDVRKTKKVQT